MCCLERCCLLIDTLRIYLDEASLISARTGRYPVMSRLEQGFTSAGLRVYFEQDTEIMRLRSAARSEYALFLAQTPFHERALTLRRVYAFPFWSIETTNKRWEWAAAKARYSPDVARADAAEAFTRRWRAKWFPGVQAGQKEGFIYVPLQGRLTTQRSFQYCSPLEMLKLLFEAYPNREKVITLHPGEVYTSSERAQLRTLIAEHPQAQMSEMAAERLLAGCDFVVTQNSSVALKGFFLEKPAVLFGRIDFHHIAKSVFEHGPEAAFQSVADADLPFEDYLYWFFEVQAINAQREDAAERFLQTCRSVGWHIP